MWCEKTFSVLVTRPVYSQGECGYAFFKCVNCENDASVFLVDSELGYFMSACAKWCI